MDQQSAVAVVHLLPGHETANTPIEAVSLRVVRHAAVPVRPIAHNVVPECRVLPWLQRGIPTAGMRRSGCSIIGECPSCLTR